MKRFLIIACASLIFSGNLFSQTAEDAIRYSQLTFGGTARGMGVSGAFGAIGADFTGVLANPAGLGLFRRSQIMFTPQIVHIKTKANYLGNNFEENKVNLNGGSLAAVINISYKNKAGISRRGKWVSTTFAFAFNRTANFNAKKYLNAPSTRNTILAAYADDLTGTPYDQIEYGPNSFESVLAYDAYLVNPLASDPSSYTAVTEGGLVNQTITKESKGGIDELSFSLANNYNEKLIFGAYLGVPILHYEENYRIIESDDLDTIAGFNSFDLTQHLKTLGVGVNFNIGIIYKPTDWVRVGASIHSPAFYGLTDDFSSSIASSFDTASYRYDSPDGSFDYNLSTPFRAVGSLGFIMNKYGFFDFDYEFVDYSRARYNYDGYKNEESLVNQDIRDFAGKAHNFRAGLELAYDIFRLRGGYAHYGSPMKDSKVFDKDGATNSFSAGFGIRIKHFYCDFAYVRSVTRSNSYIVNETVADKTIKNSYVSTFGVRF